MLGPPSRRRGRRALFAASARRVDRRRRDASRAASGARSTPRPSGPPALTRGTRRAGSTSSRSGVGHLHYIYPPFGAIVFAPFSGLPFARAGSWRSSILDVLLLGYCADASMRLAGVATRRTGWPATLALAAVGLWLEPVDATFGFGQSNLILLALVLADLAAPQHAPLARRAVGDRGGHQADPAAVRRLPAGDPRSAGPGGRGCDVRRDRWCSGRAAAARRATYCFGRRGRRPLQTTSCPTSRWTRWRRGSAARRRAPPDAVVVLAVVFGGPAFARRGGGRTPRAPAARRLPVRQDRATRLADDRGPTTGCGSCLRWPSAVDGRARGERWAWAAAASWSDFGWWPGGVAALVGRSYPTGWLPTRDPVRGSRRQRRGADWWPAELSTATPT